MAIIIVVGLLSLYYISRIERNYGYIDWVVSTGTITPYSGAMWEQSVTLTYPPQPDIDDAEGLKKWMIDNIQETTIPSLAVWGTMLIKTHRKLDYMKDVGAYQPMTIRTNIFHKDWRAYGRIYTKYNNSYSWYIYDMHDIRVRGAKGTDRITWLEWKKLAIWWFIGSNDWNYIESITFTFTLKNDLKRFTGSILPSVIIPPTSMFGKDDWSMYIYSYPNFWKDTRKSNEPLKGEL